MADIAALYRLRRTKPGLRRPYKAWGYPWVPGLYFAATATVAMALLIESPRDCAIGLGMAAAGLPFYRYFRRSSAAR
jgi:APA family basic amino acid/polyamine antiporter